MLRKQPDLAAVAEHSAEDILKLLETTPRGLTETEARRRLVQFGPNEFVDHRRFSPIRAFLGKFKSPMLILLIAAAVISGFSGSVIDAVIILAMVFASAIIDFVNTYRSERAAEALRDQVKITAEILRGGEARERRVDRVVPGDVVALAAGDIVPADSILLEGKDCFVNESVLTGESLPVEKIADGAPAATAGQATATARQASRVLYMGTSVVSGRARAVTVRTGKATRMGEIAQRLEAPGAVTEFEKNLNSFSLFLFRITLFLVLAVILIHVVLGRTGFFNIFLFAVAIAVGLTPELLPVIVTVNLAKGARKMAKGGVVVKKLQAIHNFGSIDLICTDKTGTLTEDRITLIKYVDGFGKESESVLTWGYLSSLHVTGIRGTLDHAIQAFRKIDSSDWRKVDELPFDAARRRDSVVLAKGSEYVLIVKGAPEEVLKVSRFYHDDGHDLTDSVTKQIVATYERLSADGYRVLAIGTRRVGQREQYATDEERDLIFVGFLAFLDPPKATVKATLKKMEAHHVGIKIITGDNELVTRKIAGELGLPVLGVLAGEEITGMTPRELQRRVERANLFTRIAPEQKEQIIRAFRENGHVVGYLGDGVNDVLSLRAADVGISVNNAVDIAKETADIILLNKGLDELIEGVIEGRKTFANTFKYLMMALSSNFGNMVSMPVASLFLPFLPMTASQILLNNFLYDASQLSIPFDRIDTEFLKRPKRFDIGFLKKFMLVFGPVSSIFDIATFLILSFVFRLNAALFQAGWFLESIATQALVVFVIRSSQSSFRSRPSPTLVVAVLGITLAAWVVPFTPLGASFGFGRLPAHVLWTLGAIVLGYLVLVEMVKHWFYRRWGHLIER